MHCFVSVKPEKITQDSSKNLKKMSFFYGYAKSEVRENDTFDPAFEAKRAPGKGI
jgi:hypothetical protein